MKNFCFNCGARLNKPILTETYLSEKEVSKIMGLTVRTLQTWRVKSKGPKFMKYGGRLVRYKIKDITNWMSSQAKAQPKAPLTRSQSAESESQKDQGGEHGSTRVEK